MTELKTYKMGTAQPLEGEVLNGGNDINGFFLVRLAQDVRAGQDSWLRGVVLKIHRKVLHDIPFAKAEFVVHVVNPPPEYSPECEGNIESPREESRTFPLSILSKHEAVVDVMRQDEIYFRDLLGILQKGIVQEISRTHGKVIVCDVLRDSGECVRIKAEQIVARVGEMPFPFLSRYHPEMPPTRDQMMDNLTKRVDELYSWIGYGRRCDNETENIRTRLAALETWKYEVANMLKLLSVAVKRTTGAVGGFSGWNRYLDKIVKIHKRSAPK